jgi:hypothetical protein
VFFGRRVMIFFNSIFPFFLEITTIN